MEVLYICSQLIQNTFSFTAAVIYISAIFETSFYRKLSAEHSMQLKEVAERNKNAIFQQSQSALAQ